MPPDSLASMAPARFQDLAHHAFYPEDWIIIDDRAQGRRFTLEVIEAVARRPDDPEFVSVYRVRVVESTSRDLKVGAVLPRFAIDRSKQVWGAVVRKNDRSRMMDEFQRDEFTIIEMRKFLDRQEADNYRARFKVVVDYLIRMNVLSKDDGTAPKSKNYVYVQKLCKRYQNLVWSKGGYIGSTGTQFVSAEHEYRNATGAPALIDVDLRRLSIGIGYVLSAFSCFRVRNGEEQ